MTSNTTLAEGAGFLANLVNETATMTLNSSEDSYFGYGNSTQEGYGYEEEVYGGYGSSSGSGYSYGAKKEYGEDFYYGAMSVAVLTLGLVILVEFVLHQIDHSAVGKPFYQAVLDAVYRELAVLGIVEFGVYVMQQYYEYDKDKKAVFADVHFLLFYTDIFNALQAVVQAYATQYYSDKLWVKTEDLELDHYVEIREEYDRVYEQLFGVPPSQDTRSHENQSGWFSNLSNSIFEPQLHAKYNSLLVQVRFHELRVYFLQAYKLPIKLKVSDYLKRSELNVMLSLVHISPVAWLWLTAICNLFYYLGGIIADITGESNSSATFYSSAFFLGITLMVLVAFLLDKHMHNIFHRIMLSKHLWAFDEKDQDFHQNEKLAAEQKAMFILSDPQIVVTIIQFMQFGYAIAFSIVIIYWKDMSKDDFANPHWYLWSSVICYGLFVWQMARVVPRYTLCTNLGQLVDKDLIRETVAAHKLKEAERFRTQRRDDDHIFDFAGSDWTAASSDGLDDDDDEEDNDSNQKKDTDSNITLPSSTEITSVATTVNTIPPPSAKDFVSMGTGELSGAAARLQSRRQARKKAQSEGVALMRKVNVMEQNIEDEVDVDALIAAKSQLDASMSNINATAHSAAGELMTPQRSERKKSNSDGVNVMRSKRKKSLSAGVELMQDRETLLANLVKMDTMAVKMAVSDLSESTSREVVPRGRRRKAHSTGVMAMALMEDADDEQEIDVDTARAKAAQGPGSKLRKTRSASSAILLMRQGDAPANSVVTFADDDNSVALSEVDHANSLVRVPSKEEHHEPVTTNQWLCDFFNGSFFHTASQVGGTMVCFFLVAMRVEGFLQVQCIVPEDDYSWDLPLRWSFTLEAAWLVLALATTLVLLLTFSSKEELKRHDWNTVVAGLLNLGIVGTCLALLLGAEARRCCDGGDYNDDNKTSYYSQGEEKSGIFYDSRFLADYGYGEEKECKDLTFDCTCEAFGQRVSGGLGGMEPWTALIALQMFRFILAKKITKALGLGEKDHHHGHDHGHRHGHGHGHGGLPPPSAIADAWQDAVAKHPELVEKYGEFSGEMLQAMLGLEIIERKESKRASLLLPSPKGGENKRGILARQGTGHLTLEDDRYKSLAPAAQEIIASGLAGRPVKVSRGSRKLPSSAGILAAPMAPLEFEIDVNQDKIEKEQLTMSAFEFPNARIIRSIRRCDKMFHPLLKEWVAVDVILTKHEIVYVGINESDCSPESLRKSKACNQALAATKGGKGLRLCDVTEGRRIIGHLNLDDVVAVHVDREMPQEVGRGSSSKEVDVDEEAGKKVIPKECWQPDGNLDFDGTLLAGRWNEVTQDRLKLETTRGTLYLRFYADLVDSEMHPERNREALGDEAPLHKDVAFQWAQTIVHLCVDQLKQSLPHFGDNDSNELRDYLQMVSC